LDILTDGLDDRGSVLINCERMIFGVLLLQECFKGFWASSGDFMDDAI
jgi:hypothetical protein